MSHNDAIQLRLVVGPTGESAGVPPRGAVRSTESRHSPLLANIYLHPLDVYWEREVKATKMVRYADDRAPRAQKGRGGPNVCNCLIDEGRPLGTGWQEQVPNHLRRLWSKAMVVSAEGKGPG